MRFQPFLHAARSARLRAVTTGEADYSAAHSEELGGKKIKVDLANNTDKGDYFKKLRDEWSAGTTADILYLAPRYVRSYAENGNILDLS